MAGRQGGPSILGVAVVAIAAAAGWYYFGDGIMARIAGAESNPAHAAIQQYKASKRQNDLSRACDWAGRAAAAYREAGDDASARRWALIESEDCEAAP